MTRVTVHFEGKLMSMTAWLTWAIMHLFCLFLKCTGGLAWQAASSTAASYSTQIDQSDDFANVADASSLEPNGEQSTLW